MDLQQTSRHLKAGDKVRIDETGLFKKGTESLKYTWFSPPAVKLFN